MKFNRESKRVRNKEQFDRLITPHINRLYKALCAYTSNATAAEDILQECLISVFENMHTLKEESKAFAWAYRIAINAANDYFKRYPAHLEFKEEALQGGPDGLGVEQRADLVRTLKKLDEDERQIIILRDVLGYSYAEIAEMLKLTSTNVGVRLNRARERLRQLMRQGGYFNGGEEKN